MMARSVAQHLMRFGSSEGAQSTVEEPCDVAGLLPCGALPLDDPMFSNRMAREDGVSEGLAMARAEFEARLAQETLAFEARLAAERKAWTELESETLSEKIKSAITRVESNIGGSVAEILRPFLTDALRRKIVDLLAENIAMLLRGRADTIIKIQGAEDLLAALRTRLSALSAAIEYVPSESIEVEVVSGQTIIESQIAAWIERVKSLPE